MTKTHNRTRCENPKDVLRKELTKLIIKDSSEDYVLPNDIPTKWEKHGDLILLPSYSFQDPVWCNFGIYYCSIVCFIIIFTCFYWRYFSIR